MLSKEPQSFTALNFSFKQLRPGLALTQAQINSLEACVSVITLAEDGTAIMGRIDSPTTHLKGRYPRENSRKLQKARALITATYAQL